MEAQSLVKAGQELTTQIQKASQELQKARTDVKTVPDLHAELDNLRHEHKRLRCKHRKGGTTAAAEENLIGMAREVEKLHAEVLNAEKKARASNTYGSGFVTPDPSYPAPVHGGGVYVDAYGRPLVQMSVGPLVNSAAITGAIGGTAVSSAGGVAVWGGPYAPSFSQK
ncbi:hypothetical protein GH714_008184 [Hevea brasiliensis]|uniref:Laminin subunit beta-4-like alpha-helical domain-containing protein n=1 Tax=Hevea brasiliensis TaxID=3981 RepID=A0A6A6M9J4_HEVBR|nr:hypothetical protein GH714_008184 [Hevea brasiliensis]